MLLTLGRGLAPAGKGHGTAAAPTLLLDALAAQGIEIYAAYSIRRLRAAYAGPCLRLRRGSDNVESDFGFSGDGWLESLAVTTWLDGANGYVTAWYDQSAAARHLLQPSAGLQFGYTHSTTDNGRPALRGDSGKYLQRVGFPAFTGMTVAAVLERVTGVNSQRRWITFYKAGENDYSGANSGIGLRSTGFAGSGEYLTSQYGGVSNGFSAGEGVFQTSGENDQVIVTFGNGNGFFRGNGVELESDTHSLSERNPDGVLFGSGYIGYPETNHTGSTINFQELLLLNQLSTDLSIQIEGDWNDLK